MIYIDTTGQERDENTDTSGSKFNQQEAELVCHHLHELIESKVDPASIGVISPYQAQVQLISSMLKPYCPEIECCSVDGFQGREKEAIIISLVRVYQRFLKI